MLPVAYALDAYKDSWTSLPSAPPLPRLIAPNADIANSVAVRVQYALTYAPPNLNLKDGQLAATYSIVPVVDETAI